MKIHSEASTRESLAPAPIGGITFSATSSIQRSVRRLSALASLIVTVVATVGLASCVGLTSGGTSGGPGSSTGVLSASGTSLSFGNVAVGTTKTQSVTLTNSGTAAVNISNATISGSGYTVVGGTPSASLEVGKKATIQIQLAPTSAGTNNGSLTVVSDASNSPLKISLTAIGTESGLSVSPGSVNFGSMKVGQSTTQTVKLTNNGNVDLVVTSAQVSGSGFGMSGLSLPATITAGKSVSFTVQFTPGAPQGMTGSIKFVDNATNSPQTLDLAGSGVPSNATLIVSPGSVAFGGVAVGSTSSQTITLSNTGATSISISKATPAGAGFSMSSLSTTTLNAGQSASFSAKFSPSSTGSVVGSIVIDSNATNPTVTIALSGTGTQGQLTANPSSVNFGNLPVGSSGSVAVSLTNSGTGSIAISGGSATGTGFSISGLAATTLSAGQSTSFTAKFAPSATGSAVGSISITNDAPGSPLKIGLSGVGTQGALTANPSSANFGTVTTGNSNSQTISLTNGGSAAVTISQANVLGSGFSITGLPSLPMTINAGSSKSFNAVFAPANGGGVTGSISLVSDAPTSPLTITLSGTGQAATHLLSASSSSLNFNSVIDGTSSTLNVTLTNTGNASVSISSVTASGAGFTESGGAGTTLNPNQTATLNVTFAPTTAGAATGSVTVASNATNSPTISLSGTGVQPSSHTVDLTWTASTSTGVVGYNIYRSTISGGPYSIMDSAPVSAEEFVDSLVLSGQTYFYVVRSVDGTGTESANSTEVQAAIP